METGSSASRRRDVIYLKCAMTIAEMSKCCRAQYGALLVTADGKSVKGMSWNGKPSGSENDHVCYREGLPPNSPKENCCLHSEDNLLMATSPAERKDGTIYVSGIPCNDCALGLMQSGISRLVYYAGPQPSGHRGCSDDAYWNKYGLNIERVPIIFTEEELGSGILHHIWNALYRSEEWRGDGGVSCPACS